MAFISVFCEFSPNLLYEDSQFNALMQIYSSTNGPNWKNTTGWGLNTSPCGNRTTSPWYGLVCSGMVVTELRLSGNDLGGYLPASIGELVELTFVDLSGNQLIGKIPSAIGNLSLLNFLALNGNGFSGEIPDVFSNLTSLNLLYLGANNLKGSLPPSISSCSSLQYFDAEENHLTGDIPER
jgi:hypothetical protein